MFYDLTGLWKADIGDGKNHPIQLPGTLDENKIGHKDVGSNQWHPDTQIGNAGEDFNIDAPIATRFTRKYTFEGEASFTRHISYLPAEGKRIFLEAERARCLRLRIDGKEVPAYIEPTISTPHIFEVTGLLNGDNEITLLSDNSYKGLPRDSIIASSAATDETQTNWNGVLGYLRLRVEEPVFISAVRVYPEKDAVGTLSVHVEISADRPYQGILQIQSKALREQKTVSILDGRKENTNYLLDNLPLADGICRWEELIGGLYELTASFQFEVLEESGVSAISCHTVTFGIRTFGDNGDGRLALNHRTIFLRSESNCCVFPEIGHPPMTVEEWIEILKRYSSYGVNCMRFHSHCPPDAAFTAADQMGMLMQPELSNWNPKDALESEESYHYFRTELKQVVLTLANHPSFVMLTLGNELAAGESGHRRMNELLKLAHNIDKTRLFANGSNVHYGEVGCDQESDFYTTQKFFDDDLRGTFSGSKYSGSLEGYINNKYPSATSNYDSTMKRLRESYPKPVFNFEVGQYEVLPNFHELEEFNGVSDPINLRLIQEKVYAAGISKEEWEKYVEATGEISRIGYREEIESAMRTKDLSGISLLGLQDFPGQGTALVGMLNSHLKPKPYPFSNPENFHSFFTDQLPLVLLPKYTWENTEELKANVIVANYGKQEIGGRIKYELVAADEQEETCKNGYLDEVICPVGEQTEAGELKISLDYISKASRLNLTVTLDQIRNTYPIWVYPPVIPKCPDSVYATKYLDEGALEVLDEGGIVYLTPESTKEALPHSIQAQFTTDFWSVGTFSMQPGGMGQLIDNKHPVFEDFPTDFHTNWQWWLMASQRAVILPKRYEAIITEMDSYAYLRPMTQLFECQCGNGRLLFSSLGLQNLQEYPEARALLTSIYRYLNSEQFMPTQRIELDTIKSLVGSLKEKSNEL